MRSTAGKFAPKSDAPRKVRSVNLTDVAWEWLAATAEQAGMSRNDYLEALAAGQTPFMETASETDTPQQPFIEMEELKAENERLRAELEEVRSQLSTPSPAATDCVQNQAPAHALTEAVVALREAAKRKAGSALIKEVRAIADRLAKLV